MAYGMSRIWHSSGWRFSEQSLLDTKYKKFFVTVQAKQGLKCWCLFYPRSVLAIPRKLTEELMQNDPDFHFGHWKCLKIPYPYSETWASSLGYKSQSWLLRQIWLLVSGTRFINDTPWLLWRIFLVSAVKTPNFFLRKLSIHLGAEPNQTGFFWEA